MDGPGIALVTGDLLFASRLRATVGAEALAVVDGTQPPVGDTVFVDLNDHLEERLVLISALRQRGQVRVIGFCQHDQREARIRAMEHGADEVVTNGSLQEAAVRILGQPRRPLGE